VCVCVCVCVCVSVCLSVCQSVSSPAHVLVGGDNEGRGLLLGEGSGRASVAKRLVVSVSCWRTVYP
jgi:hypothetical protein